MSGKAYSMREMKMIVEYLVEHKAYSEIRGRKMWIDFANSKALNRTWQSLKETFLKRILPDINNPYYKLNLMQIASFRQGSDVESKLNNKLDVEPVQKEVTSKENGQSKINDEDKIEDDKKEEEAPGEASKISELIADRSSIDTLVLGNCYENAEDIQKELENSDKEESNEPSTAKKNDSLKIVEEVINDFVTDDDNGDELKKRKEKNNLEENKQSEQNNCPIEISDTDEKGNNTKEEDRVNNESPASLHIDEDMNDNNPLENEKPDENPTNISDLPNDNGKVNETKSENKEKVAEQKVASGNRVSSGADNTNTTVDTQLPNNPEGLDKNVSKDDTTANKSKVQKLSLKSQKKKRSTSTEQPRIKRKKIEKQVSMSDTDAITNVEKNEGEPKVTKNNSNSEKEDQIISNDAQIVNLDIIPDSNVVEISESNSNKNVMNIENEDSCDQNIKLPAKQVSYRIYSDSNSIEETDTSRQQMGTVGGQTSKTDQIINSNSDSSIEEVQYKKKSVLPLLEKKQRNNSLARALGFTHEILSSRKRRRSYNRKRSGSHHKTLQISTDTSDYTSDTESEFISPPRGRKNRGTRKYLKPKSARILSLEEEGGLFVMHGKKIYPVVKDGKILKNYLTYTPDDESEKEESYWKLKYVEEKKKADELAKLLKQATGPHKAIEDSKATESPKKTENEESRPVATTSEPKVAEGTPEKTVKIKFTKNNEEVQLEGHWTHINPVLEQVVQMFNKNTKNEDKPASDRKDSASDKLAPAVVLSEHSDPVNKSESEANRVNKIESEIFKEIEEIDKAEASETNVKQTEDVAKRRIGRPRKTTEKPSPSPKKSKISEAKTESKTDAPATRRSSRTPKKVLNENTVKNTTNIVNNRKSPQKAKNVHVEDDVKYKFPSPPPGSQRSKRSARRHYTRSYAVKTARLSTSPVNPSLISEDTTQGYVDSDCSPVLCLRRKRRCSLSNRRQTSRIRKKSLSCVNDDITSESNSSYITAPLKSRTFTNSSVSSRIYRTESYQLLVPQMKNTTNLLEKIDESIPNISDSHILQLNPTEERSENNNNDMLKNFNEINPEGSSSMSLPTSPVLSIVENISVNKSLFSSIDENSINIPDAKVTLNELMSPDLNDVSMPLMERNYTVEKKNQHGSEFHYTINPQNPANSDTFLNKICTVKLDDITLSDSISSKLRNLLIESAKKYGKQLTIGNNNEVVQSAPSDAESKDKTKKLKSKKRSSTPRKRKNVRKCKASAIEPFIEAEHTEQCSQAGRKSCPPMINTFEDINKIENPVETKPNTTNINKKERKKKDVIKVKITRPTKRKTDIGFEESPKENVPIENKTNDAESGIFLGLNESVDLIHNHSETCLQAHDCLVSVNNSVEIVQDSKSILSIDSSSIHSEKDTSHVLKLDDKLALELLGSNAQDGSDLFKDLDCVPNKSEENTAPSSVLNTPHASVTPSSLITEDLSVENSSPRPTKWYFFSDEEATTNFVELESNDVTGYGANLNQIFPLTCAIPNLSTITEMSKEPDENTNSKKIILDDNLKNEFYSQSLFSNQ